MDKGNPEFKIKAYRKRELYHFYKVTEKTFRVWLKSIPDLGEYTGRMFTPNQVKKIVDHLGYPEI